MENGTYVLLGIGVGIGIAGFIIALKALDRRNTDNQQTMITDLVRDDQGRIIEIVEKPVAKANYVLEPKGEAET